MRQVDFDIIIIGGGHAGVEAASAASRLGKSVGLMSMDKSRLALMSCNPAIGGIGKSHIVKEIDALGGIMARAADAAGIQFRRLNLSRGPAVWSTRVQCDRRYYNQFVCDEIAADPKICVIEATAGDIIVENGCAVGVRTEQGQDYSCQATIIATGTFLGGLIHIGEKKTPAGRLNENASYSLSESIRGFGFEIGRLKTGTPPRLDGTTIDFSRCEIQPGDNPAPLFSCHSQAVSREQVPCWLTHTTVRTKEIITANLHRSPMFSGQISSTGPRYCPSVEDKMYRFAHKDTHQIFLEPEGNGADEYYPGGFSTSLPEEVQLAAMRTVVGLENVTFTRPGYAVEYDYCPAHQIHPTIETRLVGGLYFAGQINGTSGYEEAAGQGLIAGINAALRIDGAEPFIPDRSESYLGVMIDDLVTRSTTEPYRMFTSRAEHRLSLREDNARDRLNVFAKKYGLVSGAELDKFERLSEATMRHRSRLEKVRVNVDTLNGLREKIGARTHVSLADLLRVPDIDYHTIAHLDSDVANSDEPDFRDAAERAAIQIRYAGYIEKQSREILRFKKLESEILPAEMPFSAIPGLKAEAREKFTRFRPRSIGQAGRIEGITSGDIAVLAVAVKRFRELGPT